MLEPFKFDEIDINELISNTDPILWNFITIMTRNVSENRGKSADTQSHIKKVRLYFIICMLMYCTDDRCNFPMHNLLTDVVETLGGSTTLIRILNS